MSALRQALCSLLGRRPPALQVGAVCRCAATGHVLLITSRGTGRWVIPKGWPMAGKTLPGAAMIEAWEEAGVEGHVEDAQIGHYLYDKVHKRGYSIPVEVRVFLVHAENLLSDFPEAQQRNLRWFTPAEAAKRVAEPGLRKILLDLPPQPG